MKYDFDTLIDRRHSNSIKWNLFEEDVLPLWIADMDFCSPEPVIRALRAVAEHGIFGYPEDVPGFSFRATELHHAIVERLARLYQWQVEPEDLVFLPGVVGGFNLACHAFAGPSAGVLVQTPVYSPILAAHKESGSMHQEMELTRLLDGRYTIDFDLFRSAFTDETRLFILCNPHNPIGRVLTTQELETLAEICLRNQVVICSDEIHGDLIYSGQRHQPIAALDPEIARHTITLMAPSKTYNLAGLQFCVAIIQNRELRRTFQHARRGLVYWAGLMGQTAALAAYQSGQEWLDQLLTYLEANRDFLWETIQAELPEIGMAKPQGTYLAWLDCRSTRAAEDPCQFFLEYGRVALSDGKSFGAGGEGFVRLNFGCPRRTLVEALQRMKCALAE